MKFHCESNLVLGTIIFGPPKKNRGPCSFLESHLLSHPSHHDLWPVLQCLGQVHGLNILAPSQVCNGARQLQDAMICARGELHLAHRGTYQALAFILQLTELPDFTNVHVCVAGDVSGMGTLS